MKNIKICCIIKIYLKKINLKIKNKKTKNKRKEKNDFNSKA